MSLPVGTLVIFIAGTNRTELPYGCVGTIVQSMQVRAAWDGKRTVELMSYIVDFPGYEEQPGDTTWICEPQDVIPVQPPGRIDDVTTDEPVRDEVAA